MIKLWAALGAVALATFVLMAQMPTAKADIECRRNGGGAVVCEDTKTGKDYRCRQHGNKVVCD